MIDMTSVSVVFRDFDAHGLAEGEWSSAGSSCPLASSEPWWLVASSSPPDVRASSLHWITLAVDYSRFHPGADEMASSKVIIGAGRRAVGRAARGLGNLPNGEGASGPGPAGNHP